jgi:hypothetical protein
MLDIELRRTRLLTAIAIGRKPRKKCARNRYGGGIGRYQGSKESEADLSQVIGCLLGMAWFLSCLARRVLQDWAGCG